MTSEHDLEADKLISKIKHLDEYAWGVRISRPRLERWLANFGSDRFGDDARLLALYLASQFVYFGDRQIRELLKSLYRDSFRYQRIQEIRAAHGGTKDTSVISSEYSRILANSRFCPVGNPSESGAHLLYYYRQENELNKELFTYAQEAFDAAERDEGSIERITFIDDLCGSGQQVSAYLATVVATFRDRNPDIPVEYHVMFGLVDGLSTIRALDIFSRVSVIYELDDTYRCFKPGSRQLSCVPPTVDIARLERLARLAGDHICSNGLDLGEDGQLGYRDGQLLMGFHHNTPDNTMPLMWFDKHGIWDRLFRRYQKKMS